MIPWYAVRKLHLAQYMQGGAHETLTLEIICDNSYTGKKFLCQFRLNGNPIGGAQLTLSITSGSEYASINTNGQVSINEGTLNQQITITAIYNRSDNIAAAVATTTITYDNQLLIECADTLTGTSGNAIARYNSNVVTPTWSITSGGANATIDATGAITITATGSITIQATHLGYTATKVVAVEYQANTESSTTANDDGSTTTTTTTTTTDQETGSTTTESTSTTTNEDGSSSTTTTETTENQDGSSTSTSNTTNSDGSSSENTTTTNTDGSTESTTTNYDENGNATSGENQSTDTSGNNSTQTVSYDENGDPTITGYTIDTSENEDGVKEFDGTGVNTDFYGFDVTDGFLLHLHFTIDFRNQPANQNENHHQILTMKRADPAPWYGFQLRYSDTGGVATRYIKLGVQFAVGKNVDTIVEPPVYVGDGVAEYDFEIVYDPLAQSNNFVCKEFISGETIFTATNVFPDIEDLRNLTVCIGYGLDGNGNPYRYSSINVLDFFITKLSRYADPPQVHCSGTQLTLTVETPETDIYYRLNRTGEFLEYTSTLAINADTYLETYSENRYGVTSEIVEENLIYCAGVDAPVITNTNNVVNISCATPNVDIYYRINQTGDYELYTDQPIPINADTTFEAYAQYYHYKSTTTMQTCLYLVSELVAPTITCDGVTIILDCITLGSNIYYKLDDDLTFTLYTTPIEISDDTYIEAYSKLGDTMSSIVSDTCIYYIDYSLHYLTLKILTDGTIKWVKVGTVANSVISYSKNYGAWTQISAGGSGSTINVVAGDELRFKGTNTGYCGNTSTKDTAKNNYCTFGGTNGFSGSTAHFNIEGNIMSLIYGDDFVNNTTLSSSTKYHFIQLFKYTYAVSAENLILPALTLVEGCYRAMFSHAEIFTTPPVLPATTLAAKCYFYMFEATVITMAPDLLATSLISDCYQYMFTACTALNYVKCLATSFGNSNATDGWLNGVSSTGTFVKHENTTTSSSAQHSTGTVWSKSASYGKNGIPNGWTVYTGEVIYSPAISFDGEVIEMTTATEGAMIYYRLGDSGNYSVYSTPIMIDATTTVEAYATLNNQNSPSSSETCVYVVESKLQQSNKDLPTWKYNNQTITTPYSINRIDGHSSGYAKSTFTLETKVNLRATQPTYLWFQHADQTATVYVDDTLVDKHWGGYTAFFVDLTGYAHRGTNNIKVVLRNNENNTSVIAPASGDFNFNATLGKVKLFTSSVLPAMKYGYDGFHITSTVTDASATINVETEVPVGATLCCTITGVNCDYTSTQISTGNTQIFQTTITNPRLWNGTLDPYLYTITLEIYKDNELYHTYTRGYGLRYYEYVFNDTSILQSGDPYTGFLLNGEPYLLRGVCMHDDVAGKANALTDADYTQEFAIIQELGCNFIRLAHYPHPKEVYDWCDQLGIIVQTEAPCVNKLQSTMPEDYYTHLEGQYTDMVNQHYNHPCIIFWGLSNETTTNDKAFGKTKIEAYTALIKNLDPSRWVGYVMSHSFNDPLGYYNTPNVDWVGGNIYTGWYIDQASNDPSSQLDTRIRNTITNKTKPFAFSEYGCGGTQHCHSEDPQTTTTKGNYARHDIEYMMWLHEGHIAAIHNYPQLLFTSQWQLFDIAVSSRNEGYTECFDGETTSENDDLRRLNDKGLVERDHTTKKDPFYLYKAEWSSQQFIHICGKDYTKTTGRVIKCYTNAGSTASISVNGTPIVSVLVNNHIAEFPSYNYSSGDVVTVTCGTQTDTLTFA